jgi:hypothetical protein
LLFTYSLPSALDIFCFHKILVNDKYQDLN